MKSYIGHRLQKNAPFLSGACQYSATHSRKGRGVLPTGGAGAWVATCQLVALYGLLLCNVVPMKD